MRLVVENINKLKASRNLPLGISLYGPTASDHVGGAQICDDDTSFDTNDFKNYYFFRKKFRNTIQ